MLKKTNSEVVKYNAKDIFKQSVQYVNYKHVKTLKTAYSDKSDSLAVINKKVGKETSLLILETWIVNLNDFLNISRKMTPEQIKETADMIYDEFYYLKISDISLIFKRIKTGFYGEFYESIDWMKFLKMFADYSQERVNMIIEQGIREHNKIKNG